jgi:2-dehydropantoate 2-reductase
MKIAVIGAGAVGGYFGGRLAVSGNEVVFLVRGKTLEALRAGPLRVGSIKGDFEVNVRAMDNPVELGAVDAVLVAVKAWQVPEAAAAIEKMPGRESIVVPLQNGIDAPKQLTAVLGPSRVAGGLCRIVATSIAAAMWEKFLFITPWGSLGAITRLPVGALRAEPESRARLVQALEEVAAIATAEGSDLGADSVNKTLAILDGLPADTTSSMQRDIMAGRPSELEAQTGAVVRVGRKTGVPTPVHDAIYGELLPLERKARRPK